MVLAFQEPGFEAEKAVAMRHREPRIRRTRVSEAHGGGSRRLTPATGGEALGPATRSREPGGSAADDRRSPGTSSCRSAVVKLTLLMGTWDDSAGDWHCR